LLQFNKRRKISLRANNENRITHGHFLRSGCPGQSKARRVPKVSKASRLTSEWKLDESQRAY
jgi:hypothetical protein